MFNVLFDNLPYPIASGIVRGVRAFFAIVMPAIIGVVLDGSIFTNIKVIPAGYIPLLVALGSPIILGIDKWLREKGLEEETKLISTSLAGTGPDET